MAQNGGEDGQQRTDHNAADAIVEKSIALHQAGNYQNCSTGGVYHISIYGGGNLASDHPTDEGVHRNGNGSQQRQNVSIELGAGTGIGVGDEHTAGQGHGNGHKGFQG